MFILESDTAEVEKVTDGSTKTSNVPVADCGIRFQIKAVTSFLFISTLLTGGLEFFNLISEGQNLIVVEFFLFGNRCSGLTREFRGKGSLLLKITSCFLFG
jgi:hypothetical protein